MADNQNGRVAVYLDFDNIVLSWYDRVHGRNSFGRDRQRISENPNDPEVVARLEAAAIDVGAIIDYASSYGTLVLTRGYADWSAPVNAQYRSQLVARAVDLVQLFPTAAYAKNGADIRLAVDAVEDMFRLDDLTHVVIVAGDSDYVPLAQRCKRLGRYVVGIGVAGSTAKALTAACDDFATYDTLPGVERPAGIDRPARSGRGRGKIDAKKSELTEQPELGADGAQAAAPDAAQPAGAAAADATAAAGATPKADDAAGSSTSGSTSRSRSRRGSRASGAARRAAEAAAKAKAEASSEAVTGANSASGSADLVTAVATDGAPQPATTPVSETVPDAHEDSFADGVLHALDNLDAFDVFADDDADADDRVAELNEDDEFEITGLLIRALWLGQEKDDSGWLHTSAVKQQMRRMDSSFNEKVLGFRSFTDFLKSRSDVAELSGSGHERLVRLREQGD